ncbi:MAG: LuxR C-terminal-related transcriptional regulator, partial [Bacteroidota bacterium]|nr:LuxR C-terminal-related transcriptional regulator [Bacteroidota bacterium]
AIKLYHKLGHKRGEGSATMNLARVYLQSGQAALGKRLSRKSFQIFSELGMWDAQARAQISLATNERLHGNPVKANEYIARAFDVLRDHQDSGIYLYVALQKLLTEHVIDPTRKNYQKLVRLYAEIKKQKLELRKEAASEIARIAQELHLHSEAVRWLKIVHENEIERVKNEQKNMVTSLITQQEVERLANEREVEKLRMDKLELELKTKNRETDLLAAQLAKKGAFLSTLVEQLSRLRSSDPQHAIDRAIRLIQSKQFRDSEFEQLEERVTLLHRDFLASLVQRFPSLTQAERRVCILLRVGLRPAEIAGVLFASVRTVETHCLNIRKKMGIARNMRLVHVLQSM